MTTYRLVAAVSILALCAGCSLFKDREEPDLGFEKTEEQYYEAARKKLDKHDYDGAIEELNNLETRYPFGRYAEQAQLEIIYAHYRAFEPEAARSAAERFIRLHPQHPNVDYAYYMRGLATFIEGRGLFERFLPTDLTQRDPGAARDSFAYFAQLLSRFPDSPHASDAEARMVYLRNLLAAYEVHAARFYLRRKAYVAALNRGRYVVENFQETPAVPDALAIMVASNMYLNLNEPAEKSLKVLRLNYPDHPALDASGAFQLNRVVTHVDRTWANIITFGLLGEARAETEIWEAPPAPNTDASAEPARRSWLSRLTFGLLG